MRLRSRAACAAAGHDTRQGETVLARRLHVSLHNRISAFHFVDTDFEPLRRARPDLDVVVHERTRDLVAALPEAQLVATWNFQTDWYQQAPELTWVGTPAAGHDWVASDPSGRVITRYGTFHGGMIAESALATMLYFNRRLPALLENERQRGWDREAQFPGRLLANQRVLILGYGNIGRACARVFGALGMTVVGCQRTHTGGVDPETGAHYCLPDDLDRELPLADHVLLLLPGGDATAGFLDAERLAKIKPGAVLTNFGRGTTVREADLLAALDHGPAGGRRARRDRGRAPAE